MIYRRLDENWDYTFGNGKGNFISGVDAVAQAIATRLKLFMGEWWADRNDGLPLFQSILGYAGKNKETVDRLITERILGTQNVTGIKGITSSYSPDTRAYQFSATVDTAFGSVVVTNIPPFAAGQGG